MKQEKLLSILGQVDEKYIEEAIPAKLITEKPAAIHSLRVRGKIKTVLIVAVITALVCTAAASAAHLYNLYIANLDTEFPSYEVKAELIIQTISPDALEELLQTPYRAYGTSKASYAEAEDYLGVDLLISERLDSSFLGSTEGVDITGSYFSGEEPITSLTLSSTHDPGPHTPGLIDMSIYMSIGTKVPYESGLQIISSEFPVSDAILSDYVSEVNGIDAKLAVYETVGDASAYFVDNGIVYRIFLCGFRSPEERNNIDLTEYLKDLIDTFE